MTNPVVPAPEREPQRFQLEDVPQDKTPGWSVELNGQPVENVSRLTLRQDKMGVTVDYGFAEGYDRPVIKEKGGGGAVTIPFLKSGEGLFVGVVKQKRGLAGGEVLEVPRGFMDPGDADKAETAARELGEEAARLKNIAKRLINLGDANPNTAFFDTSGKGEGVSFFSVEVKPDEVDRIEAEDGAVSYQFKDELKAAGEGDKSAERILGSTFIPLHEAMKSPDMFTRAAAGSLVGHLAGQGALTLAGLGRPEQQ